MVLSGLLCNVMSQQCGGFAEFLRVISYKHTQHVITTIRYVLQVVWLKENFHLFLHNSDGVTPCHFQADDRQISVIFIAFDIRKNVDSFWVLSKSKMQSWPYYSRQKDWFRCECEKNHLGRDWRSPSSHHIPPFLHLCKLRYENEYGGAVWLHSNYDCWVVTWLRFHTVPSQRQGCILSFEWASLDDDGDDVDKNRRLLLMRLKFCEICMYMGVSICNSYLNSSSHLILPASPYVCLLRNYTERKVVVREQ